MATTIEPMPPAVESTSLAAGRRQTSFWRNVAPENIAQDNQWPFWSRHLNKRRTVKSLADLCQAGQSPLRWGMAIGVLTSQAVELLSLADQLKKGQLKTGQLKTKPKDKSRFDANKAVKSLSKWLKGTRALPQSIGFAIECLAVAHLLPAVAGEASEKVWWQLVDELWQVTQSAADWRIDSEMPPEQGLAQQLLVGELPLTLAYLLPEIRPLYKLRENAHDALSEGLVELTNGEGQVRGPYLAVLRPLLACWTRCRILGQQWKKGSWNRKAQEQYAWAVTQSLCLSAADGRSLLGQPHDASWTPEFLASVLGQGGDRSNLSAANAIFSKKLTRLVTGKEDDCIPETSDNCEWAGVATMRTDWQRSAPAVVVDYSTPDLRLEIWSGTERLIGGSWEWETTVNGKRLEPVGPWEETCWFSDEDADYLELSIELAAGARLERQIMLARDEMFLLLADYVHETGGGKVSHQFRLPLDPAVKFQPEKETREGLLTAGKTVARVLPLALPEWRVDCRFGELTASKGHLQLEQQRPGHNLACPLLIDLKRSRAGKPCTWRQLTVAESLEIQPHDVAVGYRAQCGRDQWLIYRSLAPKANRTLLGQNTSSESLVARFLAPAGEIDELVEIEG